MATKPSPPGRFSTTTGWPHFAASFSAISRAPMSAPEPGPSGRMIFTGRCGQDCGEADCAEAGGAGKNAAHTNAAAIATVARRVGRAMDDPPAEPFSRMEGDAGGAGRSMVTEPAGPVKRKRAPVLQTGRALWTGLGLAWDVTPISRSLCRNAPS